MTKVQKHRILENIFMELQAAGASLDMGQLDWAIREYGDRVRSAELDEQHAYEQARIRKAQTAQRMALEEVK